MTPGEMKAAEAGRRIGIQDVEIMMLRRFQDARSAQNQADMEVVSTALGVLRDLFPELKSKR